MDNLFEEYKIACKDIESNISFSEDLEFDEVYRWSYGDVENNGVYYHPILTDYSHKAFETFFLKKTKIQYVDLSRDSIESNIKRGELDKDLNRMTFPIGAFFQFMYEPMVAGDEFGIFIDTVHVSHKIIGVRAWTVSKNDYIAKAVVVWLRWAKLLADSKLIPIPKWFPTRSIFEKR